MEADRSKPKTDNLDNVPLRLEAHIEGRDVIRKEFRARFSRELAERKTWEENFLGRLEERKTELKTAGTRSLAQSEGQRVQQQQVDVGHEVQEGEPSARLLAEMVEQEIRHRKFLAEVEQVRIRQDQLFERLEEQRKKAEREAVEERG